MVPRPVRGLVTTLWAVPVRRRDGGIPAIAGCRRARTVRSPIDDEPGAMIRIECGMKPVPFATLHGSHDPPGRDPRVSVRPIGFDASAAAGMIDSRQARGRGSGQTGRLRGWGGADDETTRCPSGVA
jgi:hypothetical protein